MTLLRSPSQIAWTLLVAPLVALAAGGMGCMSGQVVSADGGAPCPYGSVGTGKTADGCDTCPICAPPLDGGAPVDACPQPPVCNLPNCPYGIIPQTDANGCAACPICAPGPDAGCECGAPPPTVECIGGGTPSVTCEPTASGSCGWVVGSCPSKDAGASCSADSDCPSGTICGFLEADGCSITGTCFPAPEVTCNAVSPGCACDGSEVNLVCNGLPAGYARKPLRHSGLCVDGG